MKREMVVLMVVFSLLAALFCSGCGETKEQQEYFESITTAINNGIDVQQESNKELLNIVREAQIVSDEKLDKIETNLSKMDEVIDISQDALNKAAIVYEEKRAEGSLIAGIEAARTANAVSATINPYAPVIEVGLGLAAAIATAYAGLKRKELSTVNKKYKIHKEVVTQLMVESGAEQGRKIYEAVGEKRNAAGIK